MLKGSLKKYGAYKSKYTIESLMSQNCVRFTPLINSVTTLLIGFLPWKSTKVERSTFWKSDGYKTNKNKPPNLFYSKL